MILKEKLSKKLKKSGGFTLIEMLIVVAIIAILVAVSIPIVNSNLEKAREATDAANLRAAKTVAMISALEGKLNGDGAPIAAGTKYYYKSSTGELVNGGVGSEDSAQAAANKADGGYIIVQFDANGEIAAGYPKWGS